MDEKTFEEAQLEMIKILSIAINTTNLEEKNNYLKEQRAILQADIENKHESKIKELADYQSN